MTREHSGVIGKRLCMQVREVVDASIYPVVTGGNL
jgi:hypothetical protein